MTNRTTREQAEDVFETLLTAHREASYFNRLEVVSCDIGFGVDLHVDREKWEDARFAAGAPLVAPFINGVPVCVMLEG